MLRAFSAAVLLCVLVPAVMPAQGQQASSLSNSGTYATSGVFLNAPGTGAAIPNPVHLNAMAIDPSGIVAVAVYVDGQQALKQNASNYVDFDIPATMTAPGSHVLVVQSWNGNGVVTKTSRTIQTVAPTAVNYPQIVVSTGLNASTLPTPLHLVAKVAGTSVHTKSMQVYLDSQLLTSMNATSAIDLSYDDKVVSPGQHNVVFKAWQSDGSVLQLSSVLTVSGVNPPPQASVPAGSNFANIDDPTTPWGTCNTAACSGSGANSTSTGTQKFNQATPSLTGQSLEFNVQQTNLANVLWWKNLAVDNSATQWTMDVQSYLADSTLPQALEFDMNQFVQDPSSKVWHHEVMGTQCDMKNGFFDVWGGDDPSQLWLTTPIACTPALWQSGMWHRYFYQIERLPNFQVHYKFLTFDSVTYKVDLVGAPRHASGNGSVDMAVQIDGRTGTSSITEWVDKVSVSHQ